MTRLVSIRPAHSGPHKFVACFQTAQQARKCVRFGRRGYMDFVSYSATRSPRESAAHKRAYIARHGAQQNWSNPMKAGTLARFILWNKPTLRASVADFKKRFQV
jgi:hypothetical protein